MMKSDELRDRLAQAAERHNVPGISAAIGLGSAITCASVGIANVTTGAPLTDDTLMHIGSITKVLNTTLVMQLADAGKLSLDQPVRDLVPELRLGEADAGAALTVKMLLNHTNGIDADILPDHGPDRERIVDAIARFEQAGQLFAPGADCSYSNPGMVIAGYLVQKLSQKSWYEVVHERIFAPLDMMHAVSRPENALLGRASVGHHLDPRTGDIQRTGFAFLPFSYAPAGATLMMSAGDLAIFLQAHLNGGRAATGGQLLKRMTAELMQKPTAQFWAWDRDNHLGLGWMIRDSGTIWHSGGGPGISSYAMADPSSGFIGVVLTNAAHGDRAVRDVLGALAHELAGLDLRAAPTAAEGDPCFDASRYVGTFASNALEIRVAAGPVGLVAQPRLRFRIYDYELTPSAWELKPLGRHRFGLQELNPAPVLAAFGKPDSQGRFQYLAQVGGEVGRLYRRTDLM